MKLYKILIGHYAPKDSHISIEKYMIAQDESELYDLMCEFTYWNEKDWEKIESLIPDYDSEDKTTETIYQDWKQFVISTQGELNSDWADYGDAFYGITHYGWELVCGIRANEIELLKDLGII